MGSDVWPEWILPGPFIQKALQKDIVYPSWFNGEWTVQSSELSNLGNNSLEYEAKFKLNSFNKNFRNPGANLIILIASCGLGFGAIIQQYALLYTDVSNDAFITALYVPMVPIALKIFFTGDKALSSVF